MTSDPRSIRILVADDESSVRWVMRRALEGEGYQVLEAADGSEALEVLRSGNPALAFVDIRMPDLEGLDLLERVRQEGCRTPVVIVTAHATMANAIEAMKRGAYDYLTKPFDIDELLLLTRRALEMVRLSGEMARLESEIRGRYEVGVAIVGSSPALQEIYKTVGRVAPTDATVLIQGESGTGKELIAKVIHYHSARWSGPFVALNCSAIPHDLLESELFGHERGAFTGAVEQRPGKFELAQGGTLFLDEIGDMPLALQAKLLRVLQDRRVTRLGGREEIQVDCRIVAATNQALERAVAEGRFREDLFFRLNVVPIRVPPLRERPGDIDELIDFFLEKIRREMGVPVRGIAPEARRKLLHHHWPGNVRELENTLIRAAVMAAGPTLMPDDIVLGGGPPRPPAIDDQPLEEVLRRRLRQYFERGDGLHGAELYARVMQLVEKPLLELVLEHTGGNQLRAASLLGINRNTLRKKLTQLHIDPARLRRAAPADEAE